MIFIVPLFDEFMKRITLGEEWKGIGFWNRCYAELLKGSGN